MTSTEKRGPTLFYRFARVLVIIFTALFYPTRLINGEHADIAEPFILICNHQSMMDPVLLAAKLRQHEIHFIGKRELTRFKPLKWVVERLHMVAVSRKASDLAAMRAATAVVREGHVLGIFPEGTRCHGVPMATIESGTSMISLRTRVPLLPVYITPRPRFFRRHLMVVGPPIPYEDLAGETLDKSVSDALNRRIQETYLEFANKYNKKTSAA